MPVNDFGWEKPSPGRIGTSADTDYIKENGFGNEDWNFNKDYTINGSIYGYCYYEPNDAIRKEKYNFAFTRYINGKWYLVGFYLKSVCVRKVPVNNSVLLKKRKDMLMIKSSLGYIWRRLKKAEFIVKLQELSQLSNWRVNPKNAIRIAQPIEIPNSIYEIKSYRVGDQQESS